MISYYTSDKVVACYQYQRIPYDTAGEVRNDNNSLRLSILTIVIVLDVSECWIQSRRVHTTDSKQTAVVVVNKGRFRSGQAVQRRLLQQNLAAEPGVTESTRALLVRRGCPRAGGSVMRQSATWTTRWVQASFKLNSYYIVLVAAAAAAAAVILLVVTVVVAVYVVVVVVAVVLA